MSKIYTGLGAVEYVTVTINADVDIHNDVVQLSVGHASGPGVYNGQTWLTPDVLTFSIDGKTATAKLLIGNGHVNPAAATYSMWYRVVDAPTVKIAPVRSTSFTTTATPGVPVTLLPPFVQSVTGPGVDNTDPLNPVISESAGSFSFGGWLYGDGSDGAHVCTDGEILRSGNYTDFTIPEGVTVTAPDGIYGTASDATNLGPAVIRCTGTYIINGVVDLSGADSINRHEAAVGQAGGELADGDRAGVGPFQSGGGGDGSNGAGGAVGRVGAFLLDPLVLMARSWPHQNPYFTGPGSGAGDGTNYGGGSGADGRFFIICARTLAHGPNNNYALQGGAGGPGGDDGTGTVGNGDCGGGGGGYRGWWLTISDEIVGEAGITGTGGPGGAGCGSGTDGTAGALGPGGIHLLNRAA